MDKGFRNLPSVENLLSDSRLNGVIESYSRDAVADAVRLRLEEARRRIGEGTAPPSVEEILDDVIEAAGTLYEPTLRPVINATGVVIHTNIGRAPLGVDALEAVRLTALGYSNLELDLASGERGSRHVHVESLLCRLTGAEAAMAVNNNASALLLAFMALAQGKEVIISRGEAVEIGGGFRIPDVLKQSGAHLVEVGTTNRTYAADFEQAVTENTAGFLRVHTSNFKVSGFVHSPSMEEMVAAGARLQVPVLHDIGSGCLLDTREFGLAQEPTPQDSIKAGTDLCFFSGDKLLGGPQAGIIVGKAAYVEALKRHPLARAVRLDKLTLAALAVTLLHYVRGEAVRKVPVWRMISSTVPDLERRARQWARAAGEGARVIDGASTIGGGSLPGEVLPSRVVAIAGSGSRVLALAQRLRQGPPAVIGRVEGDKLLLDPRTVLPEQDKALVGALRAALSKE